MFPLGMQSCAIYGASAIAQGLGGANAEMEQIGGGGAIGLVAAFMWLVGAAIAIFAPFASFILFAVSSALCFLGAASGFKDLSIWGIIAAALAYGCWHSYKKIKVGADLESKIEQHQLALERARRMLPSAPPAAETEWVIRIGSNDYAAPTLEALTGFARERRFQADSFLFNREHGKWCVAADVPALAREFSTE